MLELDWHSLTRYCKRTPQCSVWQGSGKINIKAWHTWHKLTLPCATQSCVSKGPLWTTVAKFWFQREQCICFSLPKADTKISAIKVISTNNLSALKYILFAFLHPPYILLCLNTSRAKQGIACVVPLPALQIQKVSSRVDNQNVCFESRSSFSRLKSDLAELKPGMSLRHCKWSLLASGFAKVV